MGGGRSFLDEVYGIDGPEATRALYGDWSDSYDSEVAETGYATPERCARALADCVDDPAAPLLDIGCGTGLSGQAFRAAGFTAIDGSDFSPEMLEKARAKRVYRALIPADLNDPLPFAPGRYANAAAVGVFSPAHAPPETIDAVMRLLPPGGCFVFSLNDHTMADPGYAARIDHWTGSGAASEAHRSYGAHLPKRGIKATVCVLRRT